ncbi:hypothetical protein DITRI_Ditri10aG0168600 [Diplodiscus trichospermus]
MRAFKVVQNVVQGAKCCETKPGALHLNPLLYHCTGESYQGFLPHECYEKAFPKLTRWAHFLKDVDFLDGRLVNVNDNSIIIDDCITPQQRKLVRLTICPQVTQHRLWTRALEEILNELKSEIDLLTCQFPSKGTKMGQQIVSSCLKFLAESAVSYEPDSASWMRLSPAKVVNSPSPRWEDVLEMFTDLINCMKSEKERLYHVTKIEVMKEGLSQIKDVLVDNSIGYKDARHQESLVQKKLSKTLGHSSQCLFTVLLYYLYGKVRAIEVDLCRAIYGHSENRFTLCMGRILTSNEEKIVWSGVKQLDRALGLFKFVWETAGMKGTLELQGHLWCVGYEERWMPWNQDHKSTPLSWSCCKQPCQEHERSKLDNKLNIYNLTSVKEASALPDLQRLEVLAGSYFCVAGALVGLLKPGRMDTTGNLGSCQGRDIGKAG